jgi:NAD(P)H-dependent FMN reductase
MDEQIRIALIYGSTRKGRFCDKVAGWRQNRFAPAAITRWM